MDNIIVLDNSSSLSKELKKYNADQKIAFVPTMGALHSGHISLVEKAFEQTNIVVVSIFVNPTQFDNKEDLEKYPRSLDRDIQLLNKLPLKGKKLIVFTPNVRDIYPENFKEIHLNLGTLGSVMEGKYRQGHFNGVVNVVKRLFDIVQPDFACFGEKDFQQLAIIQYMVQQLSLPVTIIPCPIIREPSGLAKSSRNERLSESEKEEANILYQSLKIAKNLSSSLSVDSVKKIVGTIIDCSNLDLEYFEIVDPKTLQSIKQWQPGARGCIAAYCGKIRLIDNMELYS